MIFFDLLFQKMDCKDRFCEQSYKCLLDFFWVLQPKTSVKWGTDKQARPFQAPVRNFSTQPNKSDEA